MNPALPVVKHKECLRALEKAGFYVVRRTGSHARLFHGTRHDLGVTIPIHAKELPAATGSRIRDPASRPADGNRDRTTP